MTGLGIGKLARQSDGMTDDPKNKRRSPFGPVIAVLVLLVGYVLSTGPAWWLMLWSLENGYESFAYMLAWLYLPISWLAERWEWFRELLHWYLGLWVPWW